MVKAARLFLGARDANDNRRARRCLCHTLQLVCLFVTRSVRAQRGRRLGLEVLLHVGQAVDRLARGLRLYLLRRGCVRVRKGSGNRVSLDASRCKTPAHQIGYIAKPASTRWNRFTRSSSSAFAPHFTVVVARSTAQSLFSRSASRSSRSSRTPIRPRRIATVRASFAMAALIGSPRWSPSSSRS